MILLQQLIRQTVTEEVDDISNSKDVPYVDLPSKPPVVKKKKKFPLSDRAENSLINTIWLYQNARRVVMPIFGMFNLYPN